MKITGKTRTVDEVIEAHRNDFEDWRYVPDGVKNLKDEKKALPIDEAFIDLFRNRKRMCRVPPKPG